MATTDGFDDWQQAFTLVDSPDEIELEPNQRLVAIGDIHGDNSLLIACLKAGGLISLQNHGWHWTGGNSICVQVGDILDRGTCEELPIKLLCRLSQEALRDGGRVIVLWGNHEVSNCTGDFTCTSRYSEEFYSFRPILDGMDKDWMSRIPPSSHSNSYAFTKDVAAVRAAIFEPQGLLAQPFLSKLKVAVKVGRTVLVHAGLTKKHLEDYGSIAQMNEQARQWILTTKVPDDPAVRESHLYDTLPQCLYHVGHAPTIMRDYSKGDLSPSTETMLDQVLEALHADRLAVGHTVQPRVNQCGKVWRLDVGKGHRFSFGYVPSCIEPNDYIQEIALEVTALPDGSERAVTACRKV